MILGPHDPALVKTLQIWLIQRGVHPSQSGWLSTVLAIVGVLAVALVAHRTTRWLVRRALKLRFRSAKIAWDSLLIGHGTLSRLAHFVPALVIYHGSDVSFPGRSDVVEASHRLAIGYMIVAACLTSSALGRTLADGYEQMLGRERTIRSFVQVGEIVVWILGALLLLATFVDRSPWAILGGLGAFAAVLVLVFKDALLGLVASVQISRNDMLRVGDWIEMPSHAADGEVIEILLTTVKVKNWDRTTTMLPVNALVQHAFVNWRSVHADEARRITRTLVVEHDSIRAVDGDERFPTPPGAEAAEAAPKPTTNLAAFRRYATGYLRAHPDIRDDLTLLVRELDPTAEGRPLQIYCFSRKVLLAEYAPVQTELVDHLAAMAPRFGLRLTQVPSASAVRSLRASESTA